MKSFESSKGNKEKEYTLDEDENENEQIMRYEIDDNKVLNNTLLKRIPKKRFSLLFYIYMLSILILIASIFYLIIIFIDKNENYTYEENKLDMPPLTHYNYANLTFDNGLQVLLIQTKKNDEAGGSVLFDIGYLNNKYRKEELMVAFVAIFNIFESHTVNDTFDHFFDYQGESTKGIEEYYSYFSFKFINAEFFNCLERFNNITYLAENDRRFNITVQEKDVKEFKIQRNKEKKILERIVYGYRDPEILKSDYKNQIISIMKSILRPDKMKIVIASHYKLSLMKKKFLRFFKKKINEENKKDNNEESNFNYNDLDFYKKKVILFNQDSSDSDYFKILYFVEKDENEDYYDFLNKLGYFQYIKYILEGTKKDSLYYQLVEAKDFTIKSLSCKYEVILRSKVQFEIKVNLAPSSYQYIEQIIFLIYQYMDKLTNIVIKDYDNIITFDEFKTINHQNYTFEEDTNSIQFFSKKLGIKLCEKRKAKEFFKEKYYLDYFNHKVAMKYYSQLMPNNSVILICLNDSKSDFDFNKSKIKFINFDYLFNNKERNSEENFEYSIMELDTTFEQKFDVDINIPLEKNEYISKYLNPIKVDEEDKHQNTDSTQPINTNNSFLELRYLKDTTFRLPRVNMNINLYHPFLRPQMKKNEKYPMDCIYFESILFITFLQREIEYELADAIRAGNEISVNYNQNYIFIDIFAYADIIEKISNKIYEIIYKKDFEKIHESDKIKLYIELAYENFLHKEKRVSLSRFLLYYGLNHYLYNYYEFNFEFKSNFTDYEEKCRAKIDDIKPYVKDYFLINIQIFGYCTEEKAKNISDIFSQNKDKEEDRNRTFGGLILDLAGLNNLNLNVKNFKDWTINPVYDINKQNISLKLPKNTLKNKTYRFIKYMDHSITNRIKGSIIDNILRQSTNGTSISFYEYFAIYVQFENDNLNSEFDDGTVKSKIDSVVDSYNHLKSNYSKKVDTVGDKFYYLICNTFEQENINPKKMQSYAFRVFLTDLYKDDLSELNKNRNDLKEMDYKDLIDEFEKNLYKNNHIDIKLADENNNNSF